MVKFQWVSRLSSEDVPLESREHYISLYYRPLPCSFWCALKSIFTFHNETGNIWTHLIPCLYFLWLISVDLRSYMESGDITRLPLLGLLICITCVCLVSSIAHLFCCMSHDIKSALFIADFGMISVYAVMSVCNCVVYMPDEVFMMESKVMYAWITIPSILFAGIFSSWTYADPNGSKRSLTIQRMRVLLYVIPFFFGNIPPLRFLLFVKVESIGGSPTELSFGFAGFIGFALIAIIFKSTYFPEKWIPYHFDLFGQSHQLFHIFITFSLYNQYHTAKAMSLLQVAKNEYFIKSVMTGGVVVDTVLVIFIAWIAYSQRQTSNTSNKRK